MMPTHLGYPKPKGSAELVGKLGCEATENQPDDFQKNRGAAKERPQHLIMHLTQVTGGATAMTTATSGGLISHRPTAPLWAPAASTTYYVQ